MFKTLQDVHKALQFLHSAGWVHRDVSAGNALRAGEVGKLADLEFAKCMDSNTTHEVRTGTLDFMACEVEAQTYLFKPSTGLPVDADFKLLTNVESTTQLQVPFRFNPLHDLESLWWILTWILYHHVDKMDSQPSSGQIACFRQLFPGRLNSRFPKFSSSISWGVLSASFRPAALVVDDMREQLRLAFTASETTMPPDYTDALGNLQFIFTKRFEAAVELSQNVNLYNPSFKRPRDEDALPETQDKKQPKV